MWDVGTNLFYRSPGQGNIAFSTSTSFELEAADRILTSTGTVDTGIGTAAMGIVQRAHVQGESVTESSTLGGDAAIILREIGATNRTTTDTTFETWTGNIYQGTASTAGSLNVEFEQIQIEIPNITTSDLFGTSFDFTITVVRNGTTISTITIPTITPADEDYLYSTFIEFAIIDFQAFDNGFLNNVTTVDEDDQVNVNLVVSRPTGATWLFQNISGIAGILFFTSPALNTVAGRPGSGVTAYIAADDIGNSAADIIGGFGLKLNRTILFEGMETGQVIVNNSFAVRHGTNLVVVVQWDDSMPGNSALVPHGFKVLRFALPTAFEKLNVPRSSLGTFNGLDFNEQLYTVDGRKVGAVVAIVLDRATSEGASTFRVDTTDQSTDVSNLRITSVAYEYTS